VIPGWSNPEWVNFGRNVGCASGADEVEQRDEDRDDPAISNHRAMNAVPRVDALVRLPSDRLGRFATTMMMY